MGPQSHRLVQVVLFWNVLVCQQWLSTTKISILNFQPWPDGHVCPGEKSLQIFPSNSPGPKGFLPHLAFPGCRACFCVPVLSEVPFCFSKLCLPSVVSCPVHSQNVSKAWEGWGEWGCSHSGNFLQFCSSVTSQRVLIKTGVFQILLCLSGAQIFNLQSYVELENIP